MKFVSHFYILSIFLIQRVWRIQGSADFNPAELEHLSQKLRSTECKELLESIYLKTPAYAVKNEKNENSKTELTQEDCRLKLEQWNLMFPGDNNKQARAHMITSLIHIGRTDLANVIKRNKRLVRILDNFIKPGDLYLYNKYLPKRYSKRLLSQLSPEKENNDDDNSKRLSLNEKQVVVNNSNFKSRVEKYPIKKEIANIKSKEESTNRNKFQTRAAAASEDTKKSDTEGISVATWLFICFGVLLAVSVIVTIMSLVFQYKTGKRILNAFMSKGRCDPRCKGYESFSRESESDWITDVTPRRWRRSSSSPSLTLSTVSIPERKTLKTQTKKTKKSMNEKKKKERALKKLALAEQNKKKKERKSNNKKKRTLDDDTMMSKEMKMDIADNTVCITRKDTSCKCGPAGSFLSRKSSTTQRLNAMRKKDTKAQSRKDQCRRISSRETLTKEERDSKFNSPRMWIKESIFGNPKRRDSSLKEKPPRKEKLLLQEKSPKKLSMKPCTNETCSSRIPPRASLSSN